MYLGCHLSVSAGYAAAVDTARSIGANTFAFFTRNPRGSRAKAEDPADAQAAMELLNEYEFGPLVAHGAYTMNLCTADPEARRFAADVLADDLRRMAALPGNFYNFHPGSHTGRGVEAGIQDIAAALRQALEPEYPVTVLLETMAGKGSEIGRSFQELKDILDGGGQVGRKLDFLIQEMNRESNTIASKANDIQIVKATIELKSEIEKIREQIQNLE